MRDNSIDVIHSNCLNCGNALPDVYCSTCGQKASTHRYSMKHFIEHDVIHGVWHVDKGILYTIKELFTRPGHSVREYVQGKRVHYFNFITLIVLVLTMSALLAPYVHVKVGDLMPEASKAAMNSYENFAARYPKLVLVIAIPFYSLFSFIWFRKANFNYSEHLVLNSYKSAGELILGFTFSLLTVFYTNVNVLSIIYFALTGIIIIYGVWFYYQFFSRSVYSKKTALIRSILIPFSYLFLSMLIGLVTGVVKGMGHIAQETNSLQIEHGVTELIYSNKYVFGTVGVSDDRYHDNVSNLSVKKDTANRLIDESLWKYEKLGKYHARYTLAIDNSLFQP